MVLSSYAFALIYFILCINAKVLSNVRDTLIIVNFGIEDLPLLRTYLLLPITLIFTWGYYRASRLYTPKTLFSLVSAALSVYLLYIAFYAPLVHKIHMLFFYCITEIGGVWMILVLFFGYLNSHFSYDEAKKFYPWILFIGNLASICLGLLPKFSSWSKELHYLLAGVSLSYFVITLVFPIFAKKSSDIAPKTHHSLWESAKFLYNKKSTHAVSFMIFAYFFAVGSSEILWKSRLVLECPNASDFNHALNMTTTTIGILSLLIAPLLARAERYAALLTPMLLLLPLGAWMFFPGIALLGGAYYGLNRTSKFTFFDYSKELACVKLPLEDQTKVKALWDGFLPLMGKVSESVFLQGVIIFFGSVHAATPFTLAVLLALHIAWIVIARGSLSAPASWQPNGPTNSTS